MKTPKNKPNNEQDANDIINITLVVDNKASHATVERNTFFDLCKICDDGGHNAWCSLLWEMFKCAYPKRPKNGKTPVKRSKRTKKND